MALLSNFLSSQRLKQIKPYLSGDVLDIGCGSGLVYELCQKKIKSYCGIELNNKNVKILQRKYPKGKFITRNLDDDKFNINIKFDYIILLAVIEHIFNQKHLFNEIVAHLKPDGKIIITTPTYFGNDIIHKFGSKIRLFDNKAHNDHIVIFNKDRFKTLAEEFGLDIILYRNFQFYCNQLVIMQKK